MALEARPCTLKQANELVSALHRHSKPVRGHRFSIAAFENGVLVGAIIVGRPVARCVDQYNVAEVTRLVTDGTPNACSFLYACAARAAKAMGFDRIQTYILDTESGASLRAAGWVDEGLKSTGTHTWNNRPDRRSQPTRPKRRFCRNFRRE